MTVVYWGFGLLPAYATRAAEAEDFIFENFVPSSSLLVQQNSASLLASRRSHGSRSIRPRNHHTAAIAHDRTTPQRHLAGRKSLMDACTPFVADRASHHRSCVGFDWSLCFRLLAVAAPVGRRRYHRPSASGVESSAYALSVNFIQRPLGHRVQCGRPSPLSFAGRIANHLCI